MHGGFMEILLLFDLRIREIVHFLVTLKSLHCQECSPGNVYLNLSDGEHFHSS